MNTGKNVQRLVTASAAADGPGSAVSVQPGPDLSSVVVVQASSTLASFTVQGRISPEAPWVDLHTADTSFSAAPGSKQVVLTSVMAEMRLNWATNAGTLDAWLQG